MNSEIHDRRTSWKAWAGRFLGLVYLGIGCLFGFITLVSVWSWATGEWDDYRPHDCEHLECLHVTEKADDGRVYCAEFPPRDIKRSGFSGIRYAANQILGGMSGLFGIAFGGLCVFFGARWLVGVKGTASSPVWLRRVRATAPFFAIAAPILIRLSLWPLDFFSIG